MLVMMTEPQLWRPTSRLHLLVARDFVDDQQDELQLAIFLVLVLPRLYEVAISLAVSTC